MPECDSRARERVFLALGSNLGDREENLREALNRIAALPGGGVMRVSRFLETEPWGLKEQPAFLNAAAEVATALEPEPLLAALKQIENDMGRVPSVHWGPRLIDIDIVLYGDRRMASAALTVPHPHILERAFVWEPLQEIAPEIVEKLRRADVPLRGRGPHRE